MTNLKTASHVSCWEPLALDTEERSNCCTISGVRRSRLKRSASFWRHKSMTQVSRYGIYTLTSYNCIRKVYKTLVQNINCDHLSLCSSVILQPSAADQEIMQSQTHCALRWVRARISLIWTMNATTGQERIWLHTHVI